MIECLDLNIKQGDFNLINLNFKIEKGDYVVLMGKTGCGKTTVLESICGLRKLKSGQIWLNDREITNLVPALREIGYVPQDGALFETMTVAQNIGFALRIRKWEKSKIEERTKELAELLHISYLLERKAQGLSGGEKQRVALARALSFYPDVLCLDEPLSALDEDTKERMYDLLIELKENLDITIVHVSHSKMEAIKLANRVLLFKEGTITELNPSEI